jgi:poly-gamma-glutamate capsule biosynthesis protein CapA/YwtB (metallophosphatase superfamily)
MYRLYLGIFLTDTVLQPIKRSALLVSVLASLAHFVSYLERVPVATDEYSPVAVDQSRARGVTLQANGYVCSWLWTRSARF